MTWSARSAAQAHVLLCLSTTFLGGVVAATMEINAEGLLRREISSEKKMIRSEKSSLSGSSVGTDSQNDTAIQFQLQTKVGKDNIQIPMQVLLTGPFGTFKDIFQLRRNADLFKWLGLSKDIYIRYFNDSQCRAYLQEHYDHELVTFFDSEKFGSFRGDICRTAVLKREGGFYVDLDMQLRVPLTELVDDATTFMTGRSYVNGALNALIAAVPDSSVIGATMSHIRKWYRNETSNADALRAYGLGPVTMQRGIDDVVKKDCPKRRWKREGSQFACGAEAMRFYTEIRMRQCRRWGKVMCPTKRHVGYFDGLKFGLFAGPKDEMIRASREERERNFIGWPRAQDCHSLGCRVSGGLRY